MVLAGGARRGILLRSYLVSPRTTTRTSSSYLTILESDPFTAMARSNKTYGYTIALWEVPDTAPSLFLQTSTHKDEQRIPTADLWRNLIDPSWAPFGLRHLVPSKTLRDTHGDQWNLCHYWGNFEIADMDFFREQGYRAYFEQLDRAGGFYYERVSRLIVAPLRA